MTPGRRTALRLMAAATGLVVTGATRAQAYPAKSIRLLVGFPPGQTIDIIARSYAAALAKELGQALYVDNRAGANGILAAQETKRAPADGYTLLLGSSGQLTINPSLYRNIPYDTMKDFEPVALVATGPLFLVANPSFPPGNLAELIAYAKARPGEINYGSGGQGITAHLAMELLQEQAGIKLTHVPYKGSPAAATDLIGGRISLMFDVGPSVLPHVKAGRLKVLGVSGAKRSAALPSAPTLDEQGLKGFEVTSWAGLVVPAGTPASVVEKLSAATRRAALDPQLQESLTSAGLASVSESPAYMATFMKAELPKWARAVAKAGVQLDN